MSRNKTFTMFISFFTLFVGSGFAQLPGTPGSMQTVGVFPHIVAGQLAPGLNWSCAMTLVNLAPRSANFKITFRSNDGKLLPLPVTLNSDAGVTTAAAVQGTIGANGSVQVFTSTAPGDALQEGSATVETSESVAGFAILHYTGRESEGTELLSGGRNRIGRPTFRGNTMLNLCN